MFEERRVSFFKVTNEREAKRKYEEGKSPKHKSREMRRL